MTRRPDHIIKANKDNGILKDIIVKDIEFVCKCGAKSYLMMPWSEGDELTVPISSCEECDGTLEETE